MSTEIEYWAIDFYNLIKCEMCVVRVKITPAWTLLQIMVYFFAGNLIWGKSAAYRSFKFYNLVICNIVIDINNNEGQASFIYFSYFKLFNFCRTLKIFTSQISQKKKV